MRIQAVSRQFILLMALTRLFSTSVAMIAQQSTVPTTLYGQVEDTKGAAIPAAQITLRDSGGTVRGTSTTNYEGHFVLRGIAPGKYVLAAKSRYFETSSIDVTVSPGETLSPLKIVLQVGAVIQSVTVVGDDSYAVSVARSGTKIDMPLMETPVSVLVIPAQVLADQQTVSLVDAVTNISGVAPTNDSFGTSDSFSVRGYDGAALIYQDSARMDQYSDSGFPQDMANVESVEVVKGPASVLYGQGEPGGLVNVVTKKPGAARFTSLSQQFGPHSFLRSIADGNLPLIGNTLLSRLVFERTDASSFRKFGFIKELSFYPSLAWNPSHRAELVLRTSYQRGGMLLDPGIPFLSPQTGTPGARIIAHTGPATVPISSNFIDISSNDGTGWQYDIRPELTIHLREDTDLRISYKYFYTTSDPNPPISETYTGDASIPGTSSGSLGRYGFTETYFHHRTSQVIADVPVSFKFGGISSKVLLGFDFSKDYGAYDYNGACPAEIDIYAPVYNQPIDYSSNCFLYGYGWNALGYLAEGAYFQDFMKLPHHLFALGGVRMNWAHAFEYYYHPDPTQNFTQDVHDRPANPRGGLLWQPVANISLYSNYSSNYGDSAQGLNAPGQKFLPPQSADQVEFGVKTEWFDKKLTASSAVYRIIKHNVPAPDPKNPLITIAVGTTRTEGVEFDVAGQITPDLRVIASYSNLQDLITHDTNCDDPNNSNCSGIPSQQGLPFDGIPHVTGSVWATWEPHNGRIRGLTLGAGLNGHSGEHWFQYVSLPVYESNPAACQSYPPDPTQCTQGFEDDRVPKASLVNLMAAYRHRWGRKRLSAQVNIRNLLNNYSFSSLGYEGALPNTPIQIMPEIEFKF
jgi:iron complex outermembrane receptor protein